MTSESTHPSRTSVDSTTPLGNTYRPPPKDYAAAFAALQTTYGTPVMGTGPLPGSTVAKPHKGTSSGNLKKTPAAASTSGLAPPVEAGGDAATRTDPAKSTGTVKAAGGRMVKAVVAAFKKTLGDGKK
ncbi:hypothetical protein MVEN_00438500 [Mycena venus]|uniref:Uncharacterized protein n=1 Tax=Mycena venus TaxID=2733690 RepID=A0A8H7D7Z5_9AGAR|nr:hypothetical protein MVEN_00438500 [Mycena venus]